MIYFIIGDKGSGKSLFLVIVAYFITASKSVISNLTIHFPNVEKFDIDMLLSDYMKDKDVLIDEAYLYVDCRKSMSTDNILFSQFDYQSRKNRNDVYFATQKLRVIDFRVLDFIDYIVECNHKDGTNDPFIYRIKSKKFESSTTLVIPFNIAMQFAKYYDTYEVLTSDTSELMKNKKMNKEDIDRLVYEKTDELRDYAKEYNSAITDTFIQFYLENHKLPFSKKIINHFHFEASKRGYMKNAKR